jgi:hypothetical protein
MSLLQIIKGTEASVDDHIESYVIECVPAEKRWSIPAITLVLHSKCHRGPRYAAAIHLGPFAVKHG